MESDLLHDLARRAGIVTHWHDVEGQGHAVDDWVLTEILACMQLPAASPTDLRDSLARVDGPTYAVLPPLCTGLAGVVLRIPCRSRLARPSFYIELESQGRIEGIATQSDDGELLLPAIDVIGYHRLVIADCETTLAIAPERCFGVDDTLTEDRTHLPWGLQVPLYALRRAAPTGVGDFTALSRLCTLVARHGASAIGINPVHAGSFAMPERASPYAPSSRLFLNPVYVDATQTFGLAAIEAAQKELHTQQALGRLDEEALIDWAVTMSTRAALLRWLFERRAQWLDAPLQRQYRDFCSRGGSALADHARFEALHTSFGTGADSSWTTWREPYRRANSPEVARFAHEHADEVEFYLFAQWLAARGLAAAQSDALAAGMSIGIIGDLAVGTDPAGSHAWSRQGQIMPGLVCGAPPDFYNPHGQYWGLSAFSPRALQETGFSAFIEMLRAILAHCGGVRIDHVLGLMRLWLIPEGRKARDGAYLLYPFEDMLRLIALESWRHRAIIIGENLGTVPAGFNERLTARGILGTSVLWFERHDRAFSPPRNWPVTSVATTTTHDLPTVAGWWRAEDLHTRAAIGHLGETQSLPQMLDARAQDRASLWRALEQDGRVSGELSRDLDAPPLCPILEFVASTPSSLVLIPMEDLLGLTDQANLPGTVDEHPNWRRRFRDPIDEQLNQPRTQERMACIARTRATRS